MLKNKTAVSGLGLLILLTLINLFNYLDRYILVALSPTIKKELDLSYSQVGFLISAFMFSYFLISPVFGWMGDNRPRLKVMSVGVALWSIATAASGMAKGFSGLLSARLAVGVGEAAYGAISPSILTDLFPKSIRGKIFSLFFMAIPVGSAMGFLLGGILEEHVGWRHALWFAGVPGLALALALLFFREPERGKFDAEEERQEQFDLRTTYRALSGNSDYVLTVLGYCAYTFVLGGVAAWIPHFIELYLHVPAAKGNQAFGAITVAAGFLGTFVGGYWADYWARKGTDAYLKLSALSMFLALPVYFLVLHARDYTSFCLWVFVLEFLLFLSTSPINAQIVNSVSPAIRATANAVGIFLIHLLGDAISPSLVGVIADYSSLLAGMYLFSVAILLSGVFWTVKFVFYWGCLPWPKGALTLPKVQVHRGYHLDGAIENTLLAFREAARMGAQMVELDVHLSKDGVPVVIHDDSIERTSGRAGTVQELSASDLKEMAQVPSLEEVLSDGNCKELSINIELKAKSARDDGLEQAVAKVVQKCRAEGRVLFSSFNPLSLRRMSGYLPDVPRALLVSSESVIENKIYLRKMWLACLARPHLLHLDQASYTSKAAASYRARKVPVAIWTVESQEKARKFLAMGAESIISPKPGII